MIILVHWGMYGLHIIRHKLYLHGPASWFFLPQCNQNVEHNNIIIVTIRHALSRIPFHCYINFKLVCYIYYYNNIVTYISL